MSVSDKHGLPSLLLGLFRELLANGVPLGVRDYLDGLRALQLGFGQGDRQSLTRLALALWARCEEERRLISRWFDALPVPEQALVDAIDQALTKAPASGEDKRAGERLQGKAPAGGKVAGPSSPTGEPDVYKRQDRKPGDPPGAAVARRR